MAQQRRGAGSVLPPLLLLLSMSWCCGGGAAARPEPSSDAVPGFVRSWCAGTEYPALCDATLAPYAAAVGSSPARLSWAALTVTLGGARAATAAVKAMAATGRLAPAGAEAARDCVTMLGDAEDLLRQSAEAMARLGEERRGGRAASSRDVRFQVDSVQAWASAALTDDDMCVEGFRAEAAGGGGVREAVRGHVARVAHLTANALGIVNAMAKQIP
ncbi:21 kDa protein-like [Panicum miliaceum]|uniref:21 kDa protein-like n=1 Tax=Panicum miliaceum TaxID=4540 RepID=A0A3L6TL30_PANMI|nr:21 kDa protein-like [Panicum miliaceum]